jgi:SAM-dependent methyltransferase
MYDLIARKYSQIFPLDEKRVNFLQSYFPDTTIPLLDIGCATGDLTLALGELGYKILGFDLNEQMISIAQSKKLDKVHSKVYTQEQCQNISFKIMDMMKIDTLGKEEFQGLLCFSNTLPHLRNLDEVEDFFSQCYHSLIPKGIFIVQILNFDKIIREGRMNFPVIEHEKFRFIRKYSDISSNSLCFSISIEDNTSGKVYSDENLLFPIQQNQLITALKKIGFAHIDVFTGYDKNPSDLSEFASLYIAQK